jgi:nitroreductase
MLRRSRTWCGLVLTCVVAASVNTGCTRGSEPHTSADTDARFGRSTPELASARTLVALLSRPAILTHAQRLVTARCMRRRGFPYPLPEGPDRAPSQLTLAGPPLTLAAARTHGYDFGRDSPSREELFLTNLPPQVRHSVDAALEPPRGASVEVTIGSFKASAARRGCVAEGRRRVYGSVRSFLLTWYGPQVILGRLRPFYERALRAPEVGLAISAYSACMHSAGYPASDPGTAWRTARRLFGLDQGVTRRERAMAAADSGCQQVSSVYETISHAFAESGRQVLSRKVATLQRWIQIQRRALLWASVIVAADA